MAGISPQRDGVIGEQEGRPATVGREGRPAAARREGGLAGDGGQGGAAGGGEQGGRGADRVGLAEGMRAA
jgi:hypothetical protein